MGEGSVEAQALGFEDCKAQVAQLFPKIDLSKVTSTEEVEEEPTTTVAKPDVAHGVDAEPSSFAAPEAQT